MHVFNPAVRGCRYGKPQADGIERHLCGLGPLPHKNKTFLTEISINPALDYCKHIDYHDYVMKCDWVDDMKALAGEYGFDDARIAPGETGSILVLFSAYSPAQPCGEGRISLSSYYTASNRAYGNAALLAEKLCAAGIAAKRDSSLPAKEIALKTGGFIGKNGFYYHPVLGSLVHIQTVALDLDCVEEAHGPDKCAGCGKCMRSCPAGAITDAGVNYESCVRYHMNGAVPDELKPFVYQLYGCEKCQSACPMNVASRETGNSFGMEETIKGETLPELQQLAGKNIARYVRTVNQAIIVAANTGNTASAAEVEALAGDARFADACRYYRQKTAEKD